jgi:hypothetical protein
MNDQLRFTRKETIQIAKWQDGETERDPDEVFEDEAWIDADGSVITDAARIQALERAASGSGEES